MHFVRTQFGSQAQMMDELRPKKPNAMNYREWIRKLDFQELDNK